MYVVAITPRLRETKRDTTTQTILKAQVVEGGWRSHRDSSTHCAVRIVFDITVACGFKYIGQSGRCLNTRITEHKRNVNNKAIHSQLAHHVCRNATIVNLNGTVSLF